MINPNNHTLETIEKLTQTLRCLPQNILSRQSQLLLQLNLDQQLEYLEQTTDVPTSNNPEITAVTTIKMNSIDRYAVSCLVVATEDGDVVVLDPQTFTQTHQV